MEQHFSQSSKQDAPNHCGTRRLPGSTSPELVDQVSRLNQSVNILAQIPLKASTSLQFRCRESQRWSVSMWTMPGARLKKAMVGTLERDAPCPVQIYGAGRKKGHRVSLQVVATGREKGGSYVLNKCNYSRGEYGHHRAT